jgi:hypothetical protein
VGRSAAWEHKHHQRLELENDLIRRVCARRRPLSSMRSAD